MTPAFPLAGFSTPFAPPMTHHSLLTLRPKPAQATKTPPPPLEDVAKFPSGTPDVTQHPHTPPVLTTRSRRSPNPYQKPCAETQTLRFPVLNPGKSRPRNRSLTLLRPSCHQRQQPSNFSASDGRVSTAASGFSTAFGSERISEHGGGGGGGDGGGESRW